MTTKNGLTGPRGDERRSVVFMAAVRRQFAFMKEGRTLFEVFDRAITLPGERGLLLPVSWLHQDDDDLIELLAAWRNANQFAFPSRFSVTTTGTRDWLVNRLLAVPDRLLFLVLDRHGRPIGHLGFANCLNPKREMEIDNVIRGFRDAEPGLMSEACRAICRWAAEVVFPQTLFLRVLAGNSHAIRFYQRLGFETVSEIPLRAHEARDSLTLIPCDDSDHYPPDEVFLRMDLRPEAVPSDTEIRTAGPSVSGMEVHFVADAARHGWNSRWNEYLTALEEEFARRTGTTFALATSSCTGSIHLALAALGIGPGDEVIIPDLTWVATGSAVLYVGATPVFVDVDEKSWCMDPRALERAITKNTRAVIPVHLYGHPAEMNKIMEIARHYGLYVVEDAAASLGAEVDHRPVGSFGDFSCFSFQGAKVLVTGEGGMLVTKNEDLFQRVCQLADHGRTPGTFWINEMGFKYKMSNLQAAFGLAQLRRIDEMIEKKREIFSWYEEELGNIECLLFHREQPGFSSTYWMSSILLGPDVPVTRDQLASELRKYGIDTRPTFPTISTYGFWPAKRNPGRIAARIAAGGLNLPSGVCLGLAEIRRIGAAIRKILC